MLPVFAALLAVSAPVPLVDYAGRPLVVQSAPVLRFEERTAPRPGGVDYPFAEQTAQGAAVFSRFPPFALSDRRIHVSGPWYADASANLHFSRGITSIEAMPNFRLDGAVTSVRDLPASRKWQLMGDPLFRIHAARLADRLAAADPKDARIGALRAFAVDHVFTGDEAAFRELGREVWRQERQQSDAEGKGVLYPCIDIEQTGGWEHQRNCFGWLYAGMSEAAASEGARIVPQTYGQWTFAVGAVWESMRQGGAGDPEYLQDAKDYLGAPDPTLEVCARLGGAIAMDGYMQAIWGSEPFYARDVSGAPALADGRPVFSGATETRAYGQTIPLEKGEAEHCLQDLYRQAVRMYLMHHRMSGEYPAESETRRSFLRGARISAWTRVTNEGLQGIEANDRPLPGWLLETLVGLYLMTADDIVVWSSDTNTKPGPLGGDYRGAWKYNAHGVFEYIVKAAHRYSAFDRIHSGPFRWLWFHLPMVDKNLADGERYDQKPIVVGKLRKVRGRPWIELFAAFPALDDRATVMRLWIERGKRRSPEYAIRLANGRSSFYDAWRLPAAFGGAAAADVRLRFTDVSGRTRTWTGDIRVRGE